jgi:hypothetical protein
VTNQRRNATRTWRLELHTRERTWYGIPLLVACANDLLNTRSVDGRSCGVKMVASYIIGLGLGENEMSELKLGLIRDPTHPVAARLGITIRHFQST